MKVGQIVFGAAIALSAATSSAFAGQSVVTNQFSVDHVKGHGQVNSSYVKHENGQVLSISKTLKIDAFGPSATASANVNTHGQFSGGGFATNNPTNPDPWVAVGSNVTVDKSTYSATTSQTGSFAYDQNTTTTTYSLFAGNQ
ncbi:MAG: hypothetical protein ACRCYP_03695 [Alphaproteobacteria bacterium]